VKQRDGFVSNGSSSSFIVIAKNGFGAEDLKKVFGIENAHPIVDGYRNCVTYSTINVEE